jgi:hypothetical protein
MPNPYTVCRGGAGTENVHIMQQPVLQTEGRFDWLWTNKTLSDRPADAAHVWTAASNLQQDYYDKVREIHDLKVQHERKATEYNTEIAKLKETISQKDRALNREKANIAALEKENRDLNDLKQISINQQIEIGDLNTKIAKFVYNHKYIGTAVQFRAPSHV